MQIMQLKWIKFIALSFVDSVKTKTLAKTNTTSRSRVNWIIVIAKFIWWLRDRRHMQTSDRLNTSLSFTPPLVCLHRHISQETRGDIIELGCKSKRDDSNCSTRELQWKSIEKGAAHTRYAVHPKPASTYPSRCISLLEFIDTVSWSPCPRRTLDRV